MRERTRLFLYHKPRGLMTTHADPQGRPTIFPKLPEGLPRLISVGRLDFNTEGLLLLTNDGALARVLELPATGWLRRYRVRAHGEVTQPELDALRKGVTISGIHYGAIDAALERVQGSNLWLTFAIREGKNREVRTVLSHLGLTVTRLIRVSFGPFKLGELEVGAVEEVRTRVLREQLGDKLVALAALDLAGPIAAPPQQHEEPRGHAKEQSERNSKYKKKPESAAKPERKPAKPKAPAHSWRAHEEERPGKKLSRKYRGSRRGAAQPVEPGGEHRAGLLTDRKGRRIMVERYGKPPVKAMPRPDADDRASKRQSRPRPAGRRRAPDRASGARPRQPRPPRDRR